MKKTFVAVLFLFLSIGTGHAIADDSLLAIVLAIVVGYVAIKLLFMVLGLAWTLLSWAIYAVLVGGAIYLLYKFIFNKMLGSGKRQT